MKSSFKKLPGSGAELTVEIPLDEFKTYMDREFSALKAGLAVKGFRKGMAPDEMARQVIGHKQIFDGAAERAIKSTLGKVAEENNWTIIDRPNVEIKDDPKSFSYVATLTLFPEINVAGWKKIAEPLRAELAKKKATLTVTHKEESETIEWLRASRATLSPKNSTSEKGDVVEIDMTSSLGSKSHHDRFVLGEGKFMPGFEEKIIGHAVGEKISFSLTAPADYWKKDLRGKEMHFEVTIAGVSSRRLPEPDDAFAQSVGKFTTLTELTTSIKEGILKEKARHEEEVAIEAIIEGVTKAAAIDVPPVMAERSKVQDTSLTDDAARRKVAMYLTIHALAETMGIHPTEEEVSAEIAKYGAGVKDSEPIDSARLHDYIYERIQQEKVYAELLSTNSH